MFFISLMKFSGITCCGYHLQISYASSIVTLNDKQQFPSFLRTIPNDKFQARGMARLMIHFGWSWVGILYENEDYGQMSGQMLREELTKSDICTEFFETIPVVTSEHRNQEISEMIAAASANVIAIFSSYNSLYPVLKEVSNRNVTGKVWIGDDGWPDSPLFSDTELLWMMHGTLWIASRKGEMPGFKQFLYDIHPQRRPEDGFAVHFWEQVFNCKWFDHNISKNGILRNESEVIRLCSGQENLEEQNIHFFDMDNLRIPYNVHSAVYAITHALHTLLNCSSIKSPSKGTCKKSHDIKPWQLLHSLKTVHFQNNMGEEFFFDNDGNPPAIYDVLNWQRTADDMFANFIVGRFDARYSEGQDLKLNENMIMWNGRQTKVPHSVCTESCFQGYRRAVRPSQPICCFDCIPCSEGEIANQTDSTECMKCAEEHWPNEKRDQCIKKTVEFLSYEEPLGSLLAIISIIGALIPVAILIIFFAHRHTPVVKANNREVSYLLLGSLVLCFSCSLIFIGRPVRTTCILRQTAFGIVFVLSVSCVLAKTIMVVIAFNATKPNSDLKKWVGPKLPNCIITGCTIVQCVVCTAWLVIAPPFPQNNMASQQGIIIIECNEGSTAAFWGMLGYIGCLGGLSLLVAFLSRNLPDSFNEAKYITFSMLVFAAVWLSFVPAYLSTRGKYMVAVEIFAIFSSSAGLMSCIFVPKCYVILLRPEENTREFLMGKTTSGNRNK
ncbi:extracellular calcium-sensing receptor-like [Protopterus annectens]|uniref:extracellular calcium-sensing receptor-like n=1 Tax=Protopterus annectens TaxID=7888 RepID=UPI001CFBAE7B|nr:extracellular calcium-sensing receptor-like [Protopterus annectens]